MVIRSEWNLIALLRLRRDFPTKTNGPRLGYELVIGSSQLSYPAVAAVDSNNERAYFSLTNAYVDITGAGIPSSPPSWTADMLT
jgi:hypothetical protein